MRLLWGPLTAAECHQIADFKRGSLLDGAALWQILCSQCLPYRMPALLHSLWEVHVHKHLIVVR